MILNIQPLCYYALEASNERRIPLDQKTVILDKIPFEIDIPRLFERLRIEEDDDMAEDVVALVKEASGLGRPKGIYSTAYIDEKDDCGIAAGGIRFVSRVMRVNLDKVHRFFPFVVTAGVELDQWARSYGSGLERYWADCIQEAILRCASEYVRSHIVANNSLDAGGVAVMNPGSLQDWPISEQPKLFELIGNVKEATGVELTDSFLMLPVKSISGILFASDSNYENCRLCPRENCPGRRAPYDATLYERKYK